MECCKEIQNDKRQHNMKELTFYFRKWRIGNLSHRYFKNIEKWIITPQLIEDLKMRINIDINFRGNDTDKKPERRRTAETTGQNSTELFKDYTEEKMKELCQTFNDLGYSVQIYETSRTVEISRTRNVIIKN